MKILLIIMALILSACMNGDKREEETNLIEINLENKTSIKMPDDFIQKNGLYGRYFTNFKSEILIQEFSDNENFIEKLFEGLNFYKPSKYSIREEHILEKINQNEFIVIRKKGEENKIIRLKIIKEDNHNSFIAITTKVDDNGKLYEEICK